MAFKRSGVRFPSSPQSSLEESAPSGATFTADGRPPLILVSDWALPGASNWEFQLGDLSTEFDCVSFDPAAEPPHTLAVAAARLGTLVASAPGPVFMLAHGLGTLPVLQSAREAGDAVRALALIAPCCSYSANRLERFFLRIPWAARPFLRRRLTRLYETQADRIRLDGGASAFLADVNGRDLCADLRLIEQPVALIHGDQNESGSSEVERMNAELQRSRLIRFAHLGYAPHRMEAEHLNAMVVDFFLSHEGQIERMLRKVMRGLGRLFSGNEGE